MERVLEVAASTRVLRERRARALAAAPAGALLGREIVTFRGLAERCAAETDTPVRALLGEAASAELAAACARGRGELGERLADRPALSRALAATLRDLRDAGVPPSALRGASDLAAAYAAYEGALAKLEKDGLFDRVGLFRLALRGARDWLARRAFERVEVHGATELVGSVGDLLERVAESYPGDSFRFFQPDWQSDYGERLRAEWPFAFRPEAVEVVEQPALGPGEPVDETVLSVRRASSPRAELESVAREVLRLITEAGVAPGEIQIVARSLEPYAPWLAATLSGYGIPFTSSLELAQVADPACRVWLELARVVTRDLPRAAMVRLFDSGRVRTAPDLAPLVAAAAERAARTGGVVRGEIDWRTALEALPASPERALLVRAVDVLVPAALELGSAPTFAAAAQCLERVGAQLLSEPPPAVRAALEALTTFDAVRGAASDPRAPSRQEVDRAFEAALREANEQPFADDAGGVRVLDAVQARGVPCRHLFLIGLVHGAWPRPVNEDPLLSDAARERLRERLRRPVPVTRRAEQEDRFLLGLLLSQARDHVTLSYCEADSQGRIQSPSALLRALPFVAPHSDALKGAVTPWGATEPSHARPAEALARAAHTPDARAIAAHLSGGPPAFQAGLELVTRTDRMSDDSLPYDGEVGDALVLPEELPATTLEELGQCPLRALFRRVLRVRALESPGADELEANEIGSFVHQALEQVYRQLWESGLLQPGTDPASALRRARASLPAILEQVTADSGRQRVTERHPTVWAAFLGTVTRALVDFLERDLAVLLPAGLEDLELEKPMRAALDAGGRSVVVRGQVDRIALTQGGETRIGDYKTGRSYEKPLSPTRIERGLALQLPLYARMVASARGAEQVTAEVLTVPLRPERDRDGERKKVRSRSLAELDSLSKGALAALGELLGRGLFPTTSQEQECRFCDYTVACRIRHPPTRARIESAQQVRGYFELKDRE
ncbi:MAG TPA: PD-(D/E)XK nuclease family protein [Myxococcota bacterium]|nr:PD-(D/E)XK nuclease family protein [Myxococcota bacterium]